MPTTPNPFDFEPAPAPSPSPAAPARSRSRSLFDLPLATSAHAPAHAPAPAPAHTPDTVALTPAPTPPPAPPSLPPLSAAELDALLAIATTADAIPPEDLRAHDWPDRLLAAVLGKWAGNDDFKSRARVALRYVVVLSTGERNKDALKICGLDRYGQISQWRNRSPVFNRLIHEATTRQLSHLAVPVMDSVADAAIEGDVVRKFDAEGHLKTEQRRANVRAQELFLRAADPSRFGERAAPSAAPGGIIYNIGAVNLVAAGAPAPLPLPVSPAPVLESGEKRANAIDLPAANPPQLVAPQDFTTDD